MKRDLAAAGIVWVLLTLAGWVAAQLPLLPPPASDRGAEIQSAFRTLLFLAVPVFTFVVTGLGYSVLRFRRRGHGDRPPEDGPAIHGRGSIPLAWFGITSALAMTTMVYGLVALPGIIGPDGTPDLTVQVTGFQWAWKIRYPAQNVESLKELVLPVDRTVHFEVTSLDVVHAFWIPAFGMRIDAVPGLTTSLSLRPTVTGDFQSDSAFRLQCSQLCGGSHALMRLPVRVVSDAEFTAWIASQPSASAGPAATPAPGGPTLSLAAKNIQFSTTSLAAPAGTPFTITFQNEDQGVIHNLAVYTQDGQLVDNARTTLAQGPVTQTLVLPALQPGRYLFKCDAHPTQMVGTLEVK
jgi:cytochrome c oxidase subunit 2